jgi:hypothetical protein
VADEPLPVAPADAGDEALLPSFTGAVAEVFTAGSTSSGRDSRAGAGVCDGAEVLTPGSMSCGRGVSRVGEPCARTRAGDASVADANSKSARTTCGVHAPVARAIAARFASALDGIEDKALR